MASDAVAGVVVSPAVLPAAPALLAAPRPAALDPAQVYLNSLKPSGRRTMAARLRLVARVLGMPSVALVPWEYLRFSHVAALKTYLHASREPDDGSEPGLGLSAASVNATLAALRGVATAAWNLDLLGVQELERIRAVKPVRSEPLPAGRALAGGELLALLEACARDRGPAGVRDAALIGVLYAGGLRRAELVALERSDYDPVARVLTVQKGKGGKGREVPLQAGAAAALADWLEVRGARPGRLFLPITRGGTIRGTGLTTQAVYTILAKRVAQAGLTETLSPHDLRRSFVSALLDRGADIAVVQRLAGHASVTTTARYDRRGEEAKRQAVDLLHVPYQRRGPRR